MCSNGLHTGEVSNCESAWGHERQPGVDLCWDLMLSFPLFMLLSQVG